MAPLIFWDYEFCKSLEEKGYFLIRYDNRDIGYSTHFQVSSPDSGVCVPYSIEDMVDDAKEILKHYNVDKAHVIGHSLGGTLAQLFAVTYPQMTLSLTAISSPIIAKSNIEFVETSKEILDSMWSILMGNKMFQDFERGKNEFMRSWKYLNGEWKVDLDMAKEYTKRLYETEIIEPAWNHTNVQQNISDIHSELAKLDIPILFIHGENDYLPSNPINVRKTVESLERVELLMLPKAGHMFFNKDLWSMILEAVVSHIDIKEVN